jgi:hypothetical protein
VDAPLSFATPPDLLAVAVWTAQLLVFDDQMELNSSFDIFRAAILIALAHAKRMI